MILVTILQTIVFQGFLQLISNHPLKTWPQECTGSLGVEFRTLFSMLLFSCSKLVRANVYIQMLGGYGPSRSHINYGCVLQILLGPQVRIFLKYFFPQQPAVLWTNYITVAMPHLPFQSCPELLRIVGLYLTFK